MSDLLRLTRLCDDHCMDAQATVEAPCDICGLERQLAELRKWLWLNHGCNPGLLYGDDGEMQCTQGHVEDYKRAPLQAILRRQFEHTAAKLAEAVAEGGVFFEQWEETRTKLALATDERDALTAKLAEAQQATSLALRDVGNFETLAIALGAEVNELRATLEQVREFAHYFGIAEDRQGIQILRDEPKDCWRVAQEFFRALAALDAGNGLVPTARLCTVERPGLACTPDKHHPDCPLVGKEAEG